MLIYRLTSLWFSSPSSKALLNVSIKSFIVIKLCEFKISSVQSQSDPKPNILSMTVKWHKLTDTNHYLAELTHCYHFQYKLIKKKNQFKNNNNLRENTIFLKCLTGIKSTILHQYTWLQTLSNGMFNMWSFRPKWAKWQYCLDLLLN